MTIHSNDEWCASDGSSISLVNMHLKTGAGILCILVLRTSNSWFLGVFKLSRLLFLTNKKRQLCSKVQRMILTYPLLQRKLYIVSIYCIKDFETNPAIYSHSFLLSEFYDFHICQSALNRHYYRLHETFVLTKVWNVLAYMYLQLMGTHTITTGD